MKNFDKYIIHFCVILVSFIHLIISEDDKRTDPPSWWFNCDEPFFKT
uniref:Uncharacterized protein n=1 Tax=Anguilla anguilla TaxID=7936 RepID=A0A0E9R832_ANGAN